MTQIRPAPGPHRHRMSPLDFLNHLLNFIAPAFFVALLLALLARWLVGTGGKAVGLGRQLLLNTGAGVLVLVAGLVVWGRDGRIGTYAALVLVCGTVQWALLRGWRR